MNKDAHKRTSLLLLLLLVTVCCYFPIFSNGFLETWDDQWMVMNIYTEEGWKWENLLTIFSEPYEKQYSPLVELNYLTIYSLIGYNPFAFHLVSLMWHLLCVILVFLFTKKLLNKKVNYHFEIAFITSLLFAIHPVNVEAVAWISAIKVPMYACFYILSLLLYIRYTDNEKIFYYIGALLCFICSGLCKEQAFIFPLTLILLDWWIGRNYKNSNVWLEKCPFFITGIGFALLTLQLQGYRSDAVTYTFFERIMFGCYSLFEYLTKAIVPFKLNYLYPFPTTHNGDIMPIHFYIYPFLIIGLIACFIYCHKKRIWIFGVIFFLINILLSLHIVAMPRLSIVADRYLYLSLIGILLLISYCIVNAYNNIKNKIVIILLFLLYGIYLGMYTFHYSAKWKDSTTVKEYLHKFLEK